MSSGRPNEMELIENQGSVALELYLESDSELQDAVSSFIQPVYNLYTEKLPNENQLAESLDSLWAALLDRILLTPYNDTKQDQLVTLVTTIKSLPPPDQPAPQIWGLSLWSGLPLLGARMRELWNTGPDNAENDQWLNLNAFAARLTASHALDLSIYAIWAMRSALEMPLGDVRAEWQDQTLRAAVLWVKFCGEHIHSLQQIWESDPRRGDIARGGPLYDGPTGFCRDRWGFWTRRFQILSGEEGLDLETRQMLADTARRMNSLSDS